MNPVLADTDLVAFERGVNLPALQMGIENTTEILKTWLKQG